MSVLAAQLAVLDSLIADYDSEISEMDARRLRLVSDKAKARDIRNALASSIEDY